jgi:uncharacterized protein with GYD domain
MAKYLIKGSYTAEGVRGLQKEGGSSRRAAVERMLEGVGGSVEAFYYAFGESDLYVIVDVPDATSALALSVAVNSAGAFQLSTVPLITPEEIDEACERSVSYRPPGS